VPDSRIDDLFKLPLAEFTAARNALAKTLTGDEAKSVKALAKPTVVPWAVNQLYWHARAVYHGLEKAGEKLRAAQIGVLKGQARDLQSASTAHRKAIREAAAVATRLAGSSGQKPSTDALSRMLEAISLSPEPPEHPGRFTEPIEPAGFEALAGVPVKPGNSRGPAKAGPHVPHEAGPHVPVPARAGTHVPRGTGKTHVPLGAGETAPPKREAARVAEEARQRAAEEARRKAISRAETALADAKRESARARKAWDDATAQVEAAQNELDRLKEADGTGSASKRWWR
jgi:hypothetical protein